MNENRRKRLREDEFNLDTNKLSKSCDFCKLKKVKCDSLKPICSFCLKNGIKSCNYSLMKKPGLKPGYGKTMIQKFDILQDEVNTLREQLSAVVSKLDETNKVVNFISASADTSIPSTANTNVTTNTTTSSTSSSSSSASSKSSLQIPTLLNPSPSENLTFGLPSISHCLLLIDLFFLKISPMFPLLHHSIIPELERSINNIAKKQEPSLINYAIVLITLKFLNSDQMSDADKAIYYDNCKEKIISTALKKINLENLQSLILLAYDSLGNSVKVPESWNYVSIASDYATYLKLNDEKSIVKLGVLIASDSPNSVNSSTNSNDRKSISISNRSLNLLKKPKNWIDEESRRHCFWCIYILDKLYAISSSHEMKLKSNKINCLLPLNLKYWFENNNSQLIIHPGIQFRTLKQNNNESPSNNSILNRRESIDLNSINTSPISNNSEDNYDSFTFYIELNKLVGDIHTFLINDFNINDNYEVGNWKMKFKTLENDLYFWLNSLPIIYRNFLETGDQLNEKLKLYDIMFYVYYYTTLIKLHSGAGFPHIESEYFKSSEDSKKICIESAKKVYQFVFNLINETNDEFIFEKLGPLFGFYIWINSRILFVNVIYNTQFIINSNNSNEINSKNNSILIYQKMLVFFSDILLKIGNIWESSMVYYKILQFLNVNDLSYVINSPNSQIEFDSDENSDDDITDEKREPTKVFSDMRIGSHSLLFWFYKKLTNSKQNGINQTNSNSRIQTPHYSTMSRNISSTNLLEGDQLTNFQTSNAQSFEEFQLTHDEFFNFLALDINGSGSFQ